MSKDDPIVQCGKDRMKLSEADKFHEEFYSHNPALILFYKNAVRKANNLPLIEE